MIEKFDDFTQHSDIQDDLTSKNSLLNDFEFTDEIAFDQQFEGIPAGTPVGGRQASTIAGTINSDGTVDTTNLSGTIPQANLNLADRGWVQTCAFSLNGSTPATQVDWAAGTFTSADGTAYSIGVGNTGVMSAKNYIYLDIAVSTIAYQKTTTATTAVGVGKVMVAIAQNGTTEATYKVLQGQGGENIDAANIVAGSITANEIAASTITSGKMSVTQLSAIAADLGTITAGSISINSGVASIDSSGNAIFKSYGLINQYTAGENITKGHLCCLKQNIGTWGDSASFTRETTALLSAMTYVNEEAPNTNYSADTSLNKLGRKFNFGTGISYQNRIYGKLDFTSNPPGLPAWNEIEQVFLRIYVVFVCTAGHAHTVTFKRASADWAENTITWNNQPGVADSWATSTTEVYLPLDPATTADLTTSGYFDFDITELYRLWSAGKLDNYGFIIDATEISNEESVNPATMGGRTRVSGQSPYSLQIIIKTNPGSGNTIACSDGKAYHASNEDYNLVRNIIGIAKADATAGNTIDIYSLADRSLIPSSVISCDSNYIGRLYYLYGTDGTIGNITNDIIDSAKWDLKIGIGTSLGLIIDYDKNPMSIKSVTHPGTGILPPPQARMAIVRNGTTSQCVLYKDRVTSTPLAAWASGTSGLLTSTAGYIVYWYK